jgi:hypothetical protein
MSVLLQLETKNRLNAPHFDGSSSFSLASVCGSFGRMCLITYPLCPREETGEGHSLLEMETKFNPGRDGVPMQQREL